MHHNAFWSSIDLSIDQLSTIKRITESYYEQTKEYRTKQKEIETKMSELRFTGEEYYLTSEYLLKLASNASKLFESSEVHEKRLLLKMTLQNLEIKGKIARYDWINPFDKIAFYASRQAWLRIVDNVRTIIQQQNKYIYIPDLREYATA